MVNFNSLIAILLLAPFWPTPNRHVYPDGHVERAFAIVVQDNVATCEYSIGLNSNTANELIQQLQKRYPNVQIDGVPQPGNKPKEDAPKPIQEPNQASEVDKASIDKKAGAANPKEHLTDRVTIRKFEKFADHWIRDSLKVTYNKQPLKIRKIRIEPEARHPFSMVLRFEFQLFANEHWDTQGPGNLLVNDRLFFDNLGAFRYALKCKGKTMLAQSNVAPILVRAKRIDLEELAKLAEQKATQFDIFLKQRTNIKAQLIFSGQK